MAKNNCLMYLKVSGQYTTTITTPSISSTATEATTVRFFVLQYFGNKFKLFY